MMKWGTERAESSLELRKIEKYQSAASVRFLIF